MVIELTVISNVPPKESGVSCAKYIPMCLTQKKLFILENMEIEQFVNSNNKKNKHYCVAKYSGEYYKLQVPYEELKEKYLNTNPIVGFMRHAKGNSNTNV